MNCFIVLLSRFTLALYIAASGGVANRRHIRWVLFIFFLFQALPTVFVGRLWFGNDSGRFDDGMISRALVGAFSLLGSLFVICAGEAILRVRRLKAGDA